MDELLRLLGLTEDLSALSDEELAQLLTDLRAESERVLEDGPSDEQLETLERAAAAVESIETAQAERTAEDEQRAERAQSIADRIRGQADPEEGDGEPAEGEGDEAAPEGGDATGDDAEADEGAETPEAVAAAATRRPASRVGPARARRPASMRPEARPATPQVSLVAAANLPNIPAGAPLDTPTSLARAFMAAYDASRGYRGARVKVPVARVGREDAGELFGEERTLRMGNAEENTRKVQELTSLTALTAAGGICAPSEIRYDLPVIGVDDRPVRDTAMARFGADRGGIRTFPLPEFADTDGAIGIWTHENDENPSSPTTKPCLTVTCPDQDETIVDAITKCLEFGNFRARFFPEQVQAWIDMASIQAAREAETKLLTEIGAGSTQVTTGEGLGAAVDFIAALRRLTASMRSRRRLPKSFPLRLIAPAWLLEMLATDIARRATGGGSLDEQLAIAEAQIEGWIRALGLNVTWALDGESGQVFGAQGDGPLIGWPTTAVVYVYPEGSWLFLDGGMLDLGIVRDSTLNSTNDYQVFSETFEGAHFHGLESHRLAMDLCPDGTTSGPVTGYDPCSVGS